MTERPGILCGRIGGVNVSVSLLFPAMVALLSLYDTDGTAALCLLASLMHESGHLLMLFLTGQRPKSLALGAFGMRMVLPPQSGVSYGKQIAVALAGPLVNVVAAVLFSLTAATRAAVVHAVLGAFNLLPIRPLDGGQALLYFLRRRLSLQTAEKVVAMTSVIAVIPLTAVSVFLLWYSGYNVTMLLVCLYLIFLLLFKSKD